MSRRSSKRRAQKALIVDRLLEGDSIGQAAAKAGVSRSKLSRWRSRSHTFNWDVIRAKSAHAVAALALVVVGEATRVARAQANAKAAKQPCRP